MLTQETATRIREQLTPQADVISKMFHIMPKDPKAGMVPFVLNESQQEYDHCRTKRDIIAKARQKGFSSLGIAYQVVDCLSVEGTRAVLISHEAKATQRLLEKANFYLKYINGPQAVLGRHSRNELYFPKTESSLYIGTAGAKSFGRGDTITHLHISEYAWWESDALKQVAGLFQAVPLTGTIRIESTGNGMQNDYFYMCQHAQELGYSLFFRAWWQDKEYCLEPKHEWNPMGFEHYFQDMQHRYNLTEPQLYWYWVKLLEFRRDLNTMKQEYPSSLEECFQATGGALFPHVSRVHTEYWKWKMHDGKRMEYHSHHPKPRHTYIIGADPSGGTGHDGAALEIFCLESLEQVLEFTNNQTDPVDFGHLLSSLGKEYNEAYICCEGNNHGIATHAILKKHYDKMKLYKKHYITTAMAAMNVKYGWMNNETAKKELIGCIKEALELGLIMYSDLLIEQMHKFEETSDGKMGGAKDDLVIALGCACLGIFKWQRKANDLNEPTPPKNPNDLLKELSSQNMMYFQADDIFNNINRKQHSMFPDMLRRY